MKRSWELWLVVVVLTGVLALAATSLRGQESAPAAPAAPPVPAETCFSSSEKIDGLNKICYYDCPSGKAAITIKSVQLCPLTIKR